MKQRIMIDLSKIEVIHITGDAIVIIQFTSGTTKTYALRNTEEAESLSRAFVDYCYGRFGNLYIIWQSDLVGEE